MTYLILASVLSTAKEAWSDEVEVQTSPEKSPTEPTTSSHSEAPPPAAQAEPSSEELEKRTAQLRKKYPIGSKVDAQIPVIDRWFPSVVVEYWEGRVCVAPEGSHWPPGSGDCIEPTRISPRGQRTAGLKSTPPDEQDRAARAEPERHTRSGNRLSVSTRDSICSIRASSACGRDGRCKLEGAKCVAK